MSSTSLAWNKEGDGKKESHFQGTAGQEEGQRGFICGADTHLTHRIQPSPSWQGQPEQHNQTRLWPSFSSPSIYNCVRGERSVPTTHVPIEEKERPLQCPEEKNTINFPLPLHYLLLRERGGLTKSVNLVMELSIPGLLSLSLFF